MEQKISRREVAKGAAWALPAIGVASAAPAVAVSPQPTLSANNTVTFAITNTGADASNQYRIYSAVGSADPPNSIGTCGPEVENATSAKITAVSETFWLPQSNLKFTNNGSPVTTGWGTLARDTSQDGSHFDTDGNKLYAYTSTFTGTPTTSGTNACLGIQNWISTNADQTDYPPVSYDALLRGTVNGKPQTDPGSDIPLPNADN